MKGIFKFMTVALAAGLVVSCSDDLGLDQAGKYAVGQQEGVGTIVAFDNDLATRLAAKDNLGVGRSATEGFVWQKDEVVRVFTLEKLAQSVFKVSSGQGTNTATFTILEDANLPLTAQTYAVTESQMIYGISAEPNADGKGNALPLLTLTLPSGRDILDSNHDGNDFDIVNAWTPGAVDKDNKGLRNFPVPFWGAAKISGAEIEEGFYPEDPKLTTTVQSLTAAIRINLKSLPKDTKYIVLTTHGGGVFRPEEGFILADEIKGDKDEKSTWYDASENPKNADWWITGGWGEPIAGTLRALLNPENTYVAGADKSEWPKLEVDPRLVQSDELIVDISNLKDDDRIIYLPVVCGTYKNLHVIAAKTISEKFRYCYVGTELKNFADQEFEVNKLYNLDMGLVVAEKAHLDELNDLIEANCKDKDITTVINVGTFYAYNKYWESKDTAIYVNVPGNVQLNIEKIVTCERGTSFEFPLTVTDEIKAAHSVRESLAREREVEVNLPNTWFKYDGKPVQYTEEKKGGVAIDKELGDYLRAAKLNVVCGKSDVILGSIDGNKNSLVAVNVLASTTTFESDPEALTQSGIAIYPETSAAIKIKHGFGRVNIVNTEDGRVQLMENGNTVPGTFGDLLIYTPAGTEFETEIDTLDLETRRPIYVRMDDALVYNLHCSAYKKEADYSVVTTGSSAIGYIYYALWDKDLATGSNGEHFDNVPVGSWTPYTPIDGDATDPTRPVWFKEGTETSGIGLRSFWTGSALSVRAINPEAAGYEELTYDSYKTPISPNRSYDVRTVWTVAQLASVGEGVYASSLMKSNHDFVDDLSKEVAPKVAVYNIPINVVNLMWLGADLYPWIGARARVNGFWLNGENTPLKNMNMIQNWPKNDETWIVDPHWCCTTCWKNGINPGSTVDLGDDFGLIRYIQNNDEVTVFNVNLNDVQLITDLEINNVGSIVGRISTKKANVYTNNVGEVAISIPNGKNIAGLVGYTQIGWTPDPKDEHAYADLNGNWYHSAVGTGPLDMHRNQVWGWQKQPVGYIKGWEYVGGLSGKVENPTTASIVSNSVDLTSLDHLINIESFNGHAGGLIGYLKTTDATEINWNIVECAQNIEANGGNFAGKYEGSFVGGLVGRAINTSSGNLDLIANLVHAQNIRAGKSYVGGLIGSLRWLEGIVTVDDDPTFYNADASVKSNYYMVRVDNSIFAKNTCAGGLFGESELTVNGHNTEYIKAAQVKAALIEATKRQAGGLVGSVPAGDSKVGDEEWKTTDRDRGVIVQVAKMAGGRSVGGMFGENLASGRTQIVISDGKSTKKYTDNTRNYKTYSFIEVKDWERTSDPDHDQYYGTFSNVVGYMSDVLWINNDLSTEDELGTPSYFFVIDHLDATKKKMVGYQLHWDQAHNKVFIETQKYWGDQNGYVGWRLKQPYYIGDTPNADHTVLDEQLSHHGLPSDCLFYQIDVYDQDSKLPKSGTLIEMLTSK